MFYYKIIENEAVLEIGTHSSCLPEGAEEIGEEEYSELLASINESIENTPTDGTDTEEYQKGYEQALLDLAEMEAEDDE